jgi:DNA-binding NarL/FixJ family response regulator
MLALGRRLGIGPRIPEADTHADPGSGSVTVVLLDDQALIRRAVRHALCRGGLQVVGEADNAERGIEMVVDHRPDVVLMDFLLDGALAIDAIKEISVTAPGSRVLVLTASLERDRLLAAMVAGASGCILKSAEPTAIVKGVRASAAGECVISPPVADSLLAHIRERETARANHGRDAIRSALTDRELEIFTRLASGESNQQIGRAVSLSENTVRNHVASILTKLGLENRTQAAVQAVRSGFSCVASFFLLDVPSDEVDFPSAVVSFLLGG